MTEEAGEYPSLMYYDTELKKQTTIATALMGKDIKQKAIIEKAKEALKSIAGDYGTPSADFAYQTLGEIDEMENL